MQNHATTWWMWCRLSLAMTGMAGPPMLYVLSGMATSPGTLGRGGLLLLYAGVTLAAMLLVGGCLLRHSCAAPRGSLRCPLVLATACFCAMIMPRGRIPVPFGMAALFPGHVVGLSVLGGFVCLVVALRREPALAYARWLTGGVLLLSVPVLWAALDERIHRVNEVTLASAAVAAGMALIVAWGDVLLARGAPRTEPGVLSAGGAGSGGADS
ncbi:MAG TPA: hypothetical protein VF384_04225 [Planctomycetota bacterium]